MSGGHQEASTYCDQEVDQPKQSNRPSPLTLCRITPNVTGRPANSHNERVHGNGSRAQVRSGSRICSVAVMQRRNSRHFE